MFLLDNQVVREDWKKAKSLVTDTLKKHGAKVISARRWDERRLAYPIRRRRRATYCLTYYEMGNAGITALRRDLELNENVLRYLILAKETVPAGEVELAVAEDAAGFAVPAPPPDDAPDAPVSRRREEGAEGEGEGGENPEAKIDDGAGEPAAERTTEREA
jgi:small subunit ribosomal protein S6